MLTNGYGYKKGKLICTRCNIRRGTHSVKGLCKVCEQKEKEKIETERFLREFKKFNRW